MKALQEQADPTLRADETGALDGIFLSSRDPQQHLSGFPQIEFHKERNEYKMVQDVRDATLRRRVNVS
jgi:hypothetical protein